MTRDTSGLSSPDSFAFYDPESLSLRTSQATFDLGFTPSLPTLPAWGWMSGGELYERVMSVLHISEQGSSSLLPSPQSSESTPTDEFIDEMIASGIQPDERLYMPGRKWHTQRTLSRIAPTLLPTPGANDSTGGETAEVREAREAGGPALRDIGALLSTPMGNPIGASTNPPSGSGKPSSDEQPHGQLTIEAD